MAAETYSLIAAIFSAVATGFAAVASWRAPITAARLAERLRRDMQQSEERRRQKIQVFTTLMQERSAIWTEAAVRALNGIDVVFNDARPVREAWAALLHTRRRSERAAPCATGSAARFVVEHGEGSRSRQ